MKRIVGLLFVALVALVFFGQNFNSMPEFEDAVETTVVNSEIGNEDLIISNSVYSWWISPHYLEYEDKIYFTWVNNKAEPHLGVLDDGDFEEHKLGEYKHADDHNAPSIVPPYQNQDGYVFYTGHNEDNTLTYKSLNSFEENDLNFSDNITYSQVHRYEEKIIVFTRLEESRNWAFRMSNDNGETWGNEKILISNSDENQSWSYVISELKDENLHFAVGSHPINGMNKSIYYFNINLENDEIKLHDNTVIGNVNDEILDFNPNDFTLVYEVEEDEMTRLFNIGTGEDIQIGIASFTDVEGVYKSITLSDEDIHVEELTRTGLPIEEPSGNNFYFGGMDFSPDGDIYLTREEDEKYYLEKWIGGDVEVIDQTEYPTKLFRPIAFDGGLMWIEGVYETFNEFDTQIKFIAD